MSPDYVYQNPFLTQNRSAIDIAVEPHDLPRGNKIAGQRKLRLSARSVQNMIWRSAGNNFVLLAVSMGKERFVPTCTFTHE